MASHIQSEALSLADSLSFKVQPAMSYVFERRSVTLFLTGADEYTPNGGRLAKFAPIVDRWLHPSDVKVYFTITHNAQSSP